MTQKEVARHLDNISVWRKIAKQLTRRYRRYQDEVETAVQEAYVAAHNEPDGKFKDAVHLESWIYAAANHDALNAIDKTKSRKYRDLNGKVTDESLDQRTGEAAVGIRKFEGRHIQVSVSEQQESYPGEDAETSGVRVKISGGCVPISVEKRNGAFFRKIDHHLRAVLQDGLRRNAPWESIPASRGSRVSRAGAPWGS